jgi:hypothetical protein
MIIASGIDKALQVQATGDKYPANNTHHGQIHFNVSHIIQQKILIFYA